MSVRMAVLVYLAVVNLISFAAFGWDKQKARWGGRRIPEKTLLSLAVFGGSVGAWIGMKVFRHKTKHWYFWAGFWGLLLVQTGLGLVLRRL